MSRFIAILLCTLVLSLTGCNESDLLSHLQGGISVGVDPVTGALIPNIGINIKDARGVTLLHVPAGVPISRDLARRIYIQTNNKYRIVRAEPTRDVVSQADPCAPTRAVAEPLADVVEIPVTPSLREQLRNVVLLRSRLYVRNTRPVERAVEKIERQCYTGVLGEVVSLPAPATVTPQAGDQVVETEIPQDGAFSIPATKGLWIVAPKHECYIDAYGRRICK